MNDVRVLIGGVSYAAAITTTDDLPPEWLDSTDHVMLKLEESIGKPGGYTGDFATTYFEKGSIIAARREGDYYVIIQPKWPESPTSNAELSPTQMAFTYRWSEAKHGTRIGAMLCPPIHAGWTPTAPGVGGILHPKCASRRLGPYPVMVTVARNQEDAQGVASILRRLADAIEMRPEILASASPPGEKEIV